MPAEENGHRLSSSPHLVWTVACAGLLTIGRFLEQMLANSHSVPVESLGGHSDASLVTPALFLAGATLCGAWPAFVSTWRATRRGRFTWQALVVAAVVAAFYIGHIFEAGAVALAFSVVLTFRTRGGSTAPSASDGAN